MAQLIKGKQIKSQTVTINGDTGNVVVQGNLNMGANLVTTSALTFSSNNLVTKAYVDSVAQGLDPKESVITATVTSENITIATPGSTIGGYVLTVNGSRVLLKNQTNAVQNGIYNWNGATSPMTRATDSDGTPASEVTLGNFTFVESGTNSTTGWVLATSDSTTSIIKPNTNTQNWVQFSGAGQYTADGQGIELSTGQFSLELDGTTLTKSTSGLKLNDTLSTDIANTKSELSTGLSQRVSTDVSLSQGISTDAYNLSVGLSQRVSTDVSLSTVLSSDAYNLSVGLSQRVSTDVSLSTALSTGLSQRVSTDVSLSQGISTDAYNLSVGLSQRVSTDVSLSQGISTDAYNLSVGLSQRVSTDFSLSTALSTGDYSLSTALSSDAYNLSVGLSQRVSTDVSLSQGISTDVYNLSVGLSQRVSTDVSLSTAISHRVSTDVSLSTAISDVKSVSAYCTDAYPSTNGQTVFEGVFYVQSGSFIDIASVNVFVNGLSYPFSKEPGDDYPFTSNTATNPAIWGDSSQSWNLIFQPAHAPFSSLETDDYIYVTYLTYN